jgi:lipopolysaccharide export system permease protein
MILRTIDRYLLARFVTSLFVAISTIVVVALIIDVIENLEKIVDNAATARDVFKYYLYFIPYVYKITVPAGVLLGGLFSVGLLARHNEVLAMKSLGVSLYRMATPLLIFSFLFSCFNFWFNEYVLPGANKERVRIKSGEIEKKKQAGSVRFNLSMQGENGFIFHFAKYRPGKITEAEDVLVQRFVEDSLKETFRGDKMIYLGGRWIVYNGVHRTFGEEGESFVKFDSLILKEVRERPEEFERYRGKPDEMGYEELRGYINMLKKTGYAYTRELVDLKIKLSFPFTSFIVMLVCIPIAANPKRSGVAMSFAIASGISLLYFVIFKVTQSLGYSGKLSPNVAAWSINAVFLLIGLAVFLRSRK